MSGQGRSTNFNISRGDIINQSGSFVTGVDKSQQYVSELNQYGLRDNIVGDKVVGNKIETQINNSQNLSQAAEEISELLNQLSREYPNNSAIVGAKAIEAIDGNPTLKRRLINALKDAGSAALEQLVDHPSVSIAVAGVKGFMDI